MLNDEKLKNKFNFLADRQFRAYIQAWTLRNYFCQTFAFTDKFGRKKFVMQKVATIASALPYNLEHLQNLIYLAQRLSTLQAVYCKKTSIYKVPTLNSCQYNTKHKFLPKRKLKKLWKHYFNTKQFNCKKFGSVMKLCSICCMWFMQHSNTFERALN